MDLQTLPPHLRAWLERSFLCEVRTRAPIVALTFDDGPHPSHTPRVLEILARGDHHATFFCLGRQAQRHAEIVAAAAAAGHEIANHTFSHVPLPFVSRRRLVDELRQTGRILSSITGDRPVHFRPPMGWATPSILRCVAREGYRPVLGTIYPADPHAPDAETIVSRTIARLAPGRIVILHDGSNRDRSCERTVRALPVILAQLEARGLRGVSVRELLESSRAPAAGCGSVTTAGGGSTTAPGGGPAAAARGGGSG